MGYPSSLRPWKCLCLQGRQAHLRSTQVGSVGKARRSARHMSAPKAGPAIIYVSSLAENDGDQAPANANSLEVDTELDANLPAETEEVALAGMSGFGQLPTMSAHWDLASMARYDGEEGADITAGLPSADNDDEEGPCVEAHIISDLPSKPAARSSRRPSTIMEADDEADDEADSDDEEYPVSFEQDEVSAEDEVDAPTPSIFLTTPSSKAIAHHAFPSGEESTVADMSGLTLLTDPPCSPTPSDCSSVDSPMPLTPSTDFDMFRFPTMASLSARMDDGFLTADRLFEGIPSSISFSKFIASPASHEESPASLVIRTADCLFEGIPSLGSYETLYLKSSDPPVPEFNTSPGSTPSVVNTFTSHEPWVSLSAAPVTSTSTASESGYLYVQAHNSRKPKTSVKEINDQ